MNTKDKANIQFLTRRELLLLAGGTSIASLLGQRTITAQIKGKSEDIVGCVVTPEQIEGPYFVDERLNRRDIRSDPTTKSVKDGAILNLELTVFQVNKNECQPLKNAMVDIWHCDAKGLYSDVDDFNGDTTGQKFLRGYQMTDSNGLVKFTTIYPGWYSGRTVHIHFKVRSDLKSKDKRFEHTSQLYFDDKFTKEVSKLKPYSQREEKGITNQRDGIFRDGGNKLVVDITKTENGFLGKFNIGFQM